MVMRALSARESEGCVGVLYYVTCERHRAAYELGKGAWFCEPAEVPEVARRDLPAPHGERVAVEVAAFFERHGTKGLRVIGDGDLDVPWDRPDEPAWTLEGSRYTRDADWRPIAYPRQLPEPDDEAP